MSLKSRLDRLERRLRASVGPDDPDRRRKLAFRLLLIPEHGPHGEPLTDEERAEAEVGLAELREDHVRAMKSNPAMVIIRRERERLGMRALTDGEERALIEHTEDENGMINTAIRLTGMEGANHPA
jgi:hypothetical protein